MIYKVHLNTNFMESSYIILSEENMGEGVERMEKLKLYTKSFVNEENVAYQLEYSLVIRSAEQGRTYGTAILKTDSAGNAEEELVEGLCENREEAEELLFRLADGLALPIELMALCDDYIYEKEEEIILTQVAS